MSMEWTDEDKALNRKIVREVFGKHKATLIQEGEVTVVNWRDPHSYVDELNIVIYGRIIFVTGEESCVYLLDASVPYEVIKEMSFSRLTSYMRNSSFNKRVYNKDEVLKRINDTYWNMIRDLYENEEETLRQLVSITRRCETPSELETALKAVEGFTELRAEHYNGLIHETKRYSFTAAKMWTAVTESIDSLNRFGKLKKPRVYRSE